MSDHHGPSGICYIGDDFREFPGAHVIGNDIRPIQPTWTLPNLEFIVENFEDEWLYEANCFDFI